MSPSMLRPLRINSGALREAHKPELLFSIPATIWCMMVHACPRIYIKPTLVQKGQPCYDMLRHSLTPASKPKRLCEQSQGFTKHPSAIPAERRGRLNCYKRRRNTGWANQKNDSTIVRRVIRCHEVSRNQTLSKQCIFDGSNAQPKCRGFRADFVQTSCRLRA